MGFNLISDDEEHWLMQKTRCTQCELIEEFSLTIYVVPPKKKKELPTKYALLHEKDPLMGLLAQYRRGKENPFGTSFFGGFAGACR